ncbi:mannose-1-phosphate guanylyltransferase/mannose-6-phosphate isomerase [Agrobacterium genomosp. 2]|uniref:mannose-1-phosphate guanylyltransferase n=1 Tax=Agrobacterium genomosp. 2 str. CFBP 5494 TaxID=1183436 RepID=A0A9W5F208_9HYPH|nr:mannose-1-phosphate guanylyltransferase/mannose-6-phosphate isomerase [Agrobacterium genomosp. 2]CUW97783.1 Xanthan biosynthesis protein XanB (Includes: Mannose-6-phosphate isomerase; Mannose-1-phosphate guanylyl transferase) [Agrobacterium genomosp. 2 str. CFBP 5494]
MITPILMCGGSGTRLWPLSRKSYPKQFVPLMGERTLFQQAAMRLSGPGYGKPIAITGSDFRFIVTEQLAEARIDSGAILIEPEGRNTGPAVMAAALHALEADPEAVLLVAPSDHVIAELESFRAAVVKGLSAVAEGRIVTFGITPDRPETGYGYLELADAIKDDGAPVALKRFVEKPDHATAEKMLAAGTFLWNAGIFLFAAKDMVVAFDTHAPQIAEPVRRALCEGQKDLGFLRLAPGPWAEAEAQSIDYAVMEHADNLSVVPYSGAWSDLGDWDAVAREMENTGDGTAVSGPVTNIDCRDTLLRSEVEGLELVGIGLDGIVAVATPDAVLVAHKSRAQDVKLAVSALKEKGAAQAESFPKDHRPWGWFETLVLADRFQVKRIVVHPGAVLSLQSHHHRAEHWIVVQGTARVTVNDTVKLVTENQSVYIPVGAVHRMENPGKMPMVLIEVQTGSYLGEDDIIRYEDVYSRGQAAKV